ncbi:MULTISPECIES: SCO1664 family protein [Nocardioides]|uniref:SCO1664 family protein n=1 Tax=Nocardioides kribbensis TaxID=305517 RepID=A0ABV1NUQ8_9ACTN|nr:MULTISPECIES: SCO1664 family protein [unclassified Nocardioides]
METSDPLDVLESAELVLEGRIMPASNATFLGTVGSTRVVYKPIAGEKPLWDFPGATLAHREVAAYLVSEATGWGVVPRTWLRGGPHGPGMVQQWQEPDAEQEAVTLVPEGEVPPGYLHVFDGLDARDRPIALVHEDTPALRRMAVFDVVVNNADRKGGHVLEMADGHRFGVDHGIAFHHEHKLRTVLWGWVGEPLTDEERGAVTAVREGLAGALGASLAPLLTDLEIDCIARRCDRLLHRGSLPAPRGEHPAIPWPPF